MNRGYVIIAQNTDSTDYVHCAKMLAYSIKKIMPTESISIISDNDVKDSVFDNIIKLPYGDMDNSEWKLSNDWQVYESSPYEYTIKIEADMYVSRNIDWWWDILKHGELNICTTIRNYKSEISTVDTYRKTILNNKLPNTFNALTYYKKSTLAAEFFSVVKEIFKNWNDYKSVLDYCPDLIPTTDVVYALAARYIGEQWCTNPSFTDYSFVHMKQSVNNLRGRDWTKELVYEILEDTFRIHSYTQLYPVHYHIKNFSKTISEELNA